MNRANALPIRDKLALSFIGFVSVTLALFAAGFYVLEHRSVKSAQDADRRETAANLTAVCRETELHRSPIVAINYTQELRKDPSLHAAACLGMDGRVKAHTDPAHIGDILEPAARKALVAAGASERAFGGVPGRDLVERLEPVFNGAKQIGVARILWDRDILERNLRVRLMGVIRRTVETSCVVFVLAVLAALLLARHLTRPLEDLVRGARAVTENRLSHRIPNGRRDEFGVLIDHFNAMARKLGEVEKMKDKFLASLTHDMKNPLTGLIAGIKMMEAGTLTEPQRSTCGTAFKNARRLGSYIDDILDLSKIQAGRLDLRLAPIRTDELLREVEEIQREAFREAGVELRLPADQEMPSVPMDRKMVLRVLNTLLVNAWAFTPEGGCVRVEAGAGPGPRGSELRLSVFDNGRGVPAGEHGRIFDRFYQADDSARRLRGDPGHGLGLAICREIMEGHGGRIWAEAAEDGGTAFHVALPFGDEAGATSRRRASSVRSAA